MPCCPAGGNGGQRADTGRAKQIHTAVTNIRDGPEQGRTSSPGASTAHSPKMDETCTPNPILVQTRRNDIVENSHRGVVCVVQCAVGRGDHEVLWSAGNVKQIFYPRSAMKYCQILPLLESGAANYFDFTDQEIAIMCASHEGHKVHLETVRGILRKIGCDESMLQCGGHVPSLASAFVYCVEAGTSLYPFHEPIYNNCSGKHAGMLALCTFLKVPQDTYLEPSHPVQMLIRQAASDVFQLPLESMHIGVDGCSAPAIAMPIENAALGYARLSLPEVYADAHRRDAVRRMARAVGAHPEMVQGEGCFDTMLMSCYRGRLIAKRGAAGAYCVSLLGQGVGFVCKLDGNDEFKYNVAMRFVQWRGVCAVNAEAQGGAERAPVSLSESSEGVEEGTTARGPVTAAVWTCPPRLQRFVLTPNVNCRGLLVGASTVVPSVLPL